MNAENFGNVRPILALCLIENPLKFGNIGCQRFIAILFEIMQSILSFLNFIEVTINQRQLVKDGVVILSSSR